MTTSSDDQPPNDNARDQNRSVEERLHALSERLQILVKQLDQHEVSRLDEPNERDAQSRIQAEQVPTDEIAHPSDDVVGHDSLRANASPRGGEQAEVRNGVAATEDAVRKSAEGPPDPAGQSLRHSKSLPQVHREIGSQFVPSAKSALSRVTIGGREYRAADWSLSGLRVTDFDQNANQGDQIPVTLSIPFQGLYAALVVSAEVAHTRTDNGDLELKFVDLSQRSRELMAHFLDALIDGPAGATADATRLIDPSGAFAAGERPRGDARKGPARQRRIGSIMISSLYIVIGMTVVTYLVFAVLANVLRLEVGSAVLAAPIQTLSAPADGILVSIEKAEHDEVLVDDNLFAVDDPIVQERVARAAVLVDEKRSRVTLLQAIVERAARRGAQTNAARAAELAAARREVEFAIRQLTAIESYRDGMVVKAPTGGWVRQIFKAPGSMVEKGEPIVLFERTGEPRQIHAFLTQDEALDVAKGDSARVYFPSADVGFDAVVVRIDRSLSAISSGGARYDWGEDRSALVVLDQPDLNAPAFRKKLDAGLPAFVVFQRSLSSALIPDFIDGSNSSHGSPVAIPERIVPQQ